MSPKPATERCCIDGCEHPPRTESLAEEALDGRTPKYVVAKGDGSPVDPTARYLVLRIDGKARGSPELQALREYLGALNATEDGRKLAAHLRVYFGFGEVVA